MTKKEERQKIAAANKQLRLELKESVLKASEKGISVKDIAGQFGVPKGTVRTWIKEAAKVDLSLRPTYSGKTWEMTFTGVFKEELSLVGLVTQVEQRLIALQEDVAILKKLVG